ncbi:Utp14-domain-containing protein [Delitschia confertaspora ATCC 74209]|uniref:Utp14-domain-containing protein n=1 Tax=Delitschia confertaspora ATCC 74209 TaxID=1513339 RepID=A0A9P4MU80_9PLEO|nr:Utp14-domain-containing protein [Delitschia confertaspora ATCC 74209]
MPPRVSRASVPKSSKTRSHVSAKRAKKAQSRSLNAFAIANHEVPENIKVRQHRLGESDVGPSRRKRQRDEDDEDDEDDDEEEEGGRSKHNKRVKGRFDELDIDEGSDSEGNHWTMGHVDSDDDEDIDSDEAFGESDEERFDGWTFRGSSSNHKKSKPKKRVRDVPEDDADINLDEEDSAEDDDSDGSLGEDAVDLATMLDQYEESDEEQKPKKGKKSKTRDMDSEDEPSEEGYSDGDGASDFAMSDDEDDDEDNDPSKIAQLKNLISSLPQDEEPQSKGHRRSEVHESGAPSEFGVFRKVDLTAFKPKNADAEKKKAFKLLEDNVKSSKRNSIARKLDAPLPKRQQDKLDRAVATEKANETLERWVDTVKTQRRAEHLHFPLVHPNAGESMGETKLLPTQTIAPANDLESTIQSILQESGLSNGKDDEEQIQKWEELQTNKLPLEEVMARRAELRKQRELLFREEVRAKRVKKIKSKAYRRVHRKERERMAQRERDALIADGVDLSEDEKEYNDRRRAEERMGAKHRESKWAKGVKQSGKAAWDEDARAGVTEMARRNEELRRRIEGKDVRAEDEDNSDLSTDDDEDEGEDDEVLKRQVGRLQKNPLSAGTSKLGSMAFMQKAEAARKARNDEDIERIRRELAGEDSQSENDDDNATRAGRRKYAPNTHVNLPNIPTNRNEFEEPEGYDEEGREPVVDGEGILERPVNGLSNGSRKNPFSMKSNNTKDVPASANPFLQPASKSKEKSMASSDNPFLQPASKTQENKSQSTESALWKAQDTVSALQGKPKTKAKANAKIKSKSKKSSEDDGFPEPQISAPDADGWQTVTYNDNDNEDDEDIEHEGIDLDLVMRNQSLTAKAFAGDDVEAEFAAEKAAIIADEDDKIVDATLPGWGTWTGSGLSKQAQKKNRGKVMVKVEGVKQADKRKDMKLERVIINERKVKKNTKFLATNLPFPFETREQYERSLRIPKGPEWTTKQSFQDGTKPRVMVKQGIIKPMAKPLV